MLGHLPGALDLGSGNSELDAVVDHRFSHVQRRHVERLRIGFEELDRLVVQHRSMVDAPYAGADRGFDALRPVRVRRDITSPARRFLDRHPELLVGILLGAGVDALRENGARRQDLDEVRAVLEVRAHGVADGVHSIRQVLDQRNVDVHRELAGVARATGGAHVVSGDGEPRAGHEAFVDRFPQFDVDVGPLRTHVAAGGEAGAEGVERVLRAMERGARRRRLHERVLPMDRAARQVGVKVDHTREGASPARGPGPWHPRGWRGPCPPTRSSLRE